MITMATQAAMGSPGMKATSLLTEHFSSFCNAGNYQLATTNDGLYLLNNDQSNVPQNTVTLATTDYTIRNAKRMRFFYIGIETSNPFQVTLAADGKEALVYTVKNIQEGYQQIKVPIGRGIQGWYWTVTISSDDWFRLDSIEGLVIIRSSRMYGG